MLEQKVFLIGCRLELDSVREMKTVEEIKEEYEDEWILAEVIEENEKGEPTKVELIAHSKCRDDTYDKMSETEAKHLYHFYTGNIPEKGYAVAFEVTR